MSATVLRFPLELAPLIPRQCVRVMRAGSYDETLVICDSYGWLYPVWASAINEPVQLAGRSRRRNPTRSLKGRR